MKLRPTTIFSTLLLIMTLVGPLSAQERQYLKYPGSWSHPNKFGVDSREAMLTLEQFHREEKIYIQMRDGVNLSAEIFYPQKKRENLPVVLMRTPYHPDEFVIPWMVQAISHFLKNGYVVVIQSERGRHWSEGKFRFLNGARNDGYDTLEWISKQPWSNGKVGTFGCSSSAENQLGLAATNHPAHAAAIPMSPGAGIGKMGPFQEQGNFYRGGVWQALWLPWYYDQGRRYRPQFPKNLTQEERINLSKFYRLEPTMPPVEFDKVIWELPTKDLMKKIDAPASDLDDFIVRHPGDRKWRDVEYFNEGDKFGPPALWMFSWYDVSVSPNIALFNYVQTNAFTKEGANNQFMVINATDHCGQGKEVEQTIVGARDVGDARYDYLKLFTDWFDYWLKGEDTDIVSRPKVQLYTFGANEWRYYDQWPAKAVEFESLYFESAGNANSSAGDGQLVRSIPQQAQADTFVYDPAKPVPSLGGSICCFGPQLIGGAFDQSGLELRHDILVYSTPLLEKDLTVVGPIEIVLYVSSNVRDTDLTVKLVDVQPDGAAYNLDDSIQRVRFRDGYDEQKFMSEGGVYEVRIGPLAVSNVFKAGHRLRVEISSSNFPRYARNLNTGGNNYDEISSQTAINKIHHSPDYPSRIVIPVLDEKN